MTPKAAAILTLHGAVIHVRTQRTIFYRTDDWESPRWYSLVLAEAILHDKLRALLQEVF